MDEDVTVVADSTKAVPVMEIRPASEAPVVEEAKEPEGSAGGNASVDADASVTFGDQNSAAEGLLELSNAGEIV